MNTVQKNKVDMYVTVQSMVNRHQQAWQGLPAFVRAYASFQETVTEIHQLALVQANRLGGVEEKAAARRALGDLAYEVAAAARVCAVVATDEALVARLRVSRASLTAGRTGTVLERCRDIHAAASEHGPVLAEYGVPAEKLAQLQEVIETFARLQVRPRENRVAARAAGQRLVSLLQKADRLLSVQLDALCVQFRETPVRFLEEYFAARVIVNHRATHAGKEEPVVPVQSAPASGVTTTGTALEKAA